jgi:hypothetical protein
MNYSICKNKPIRFIFHIFEKNSSLKTKLVLYEKELYCFSFNRSYSCNDKRIS